MKIDRIEFISYFLYMLLFFQACNKNDQIPYCPTVIPDWPDSIYFIGSAAVIESLTTEESRPIQIANATNAAIGQLLDTLLNLEYQGDITFQEQDSIERERGDFLIEGNSYIYNFLVTQIDTAISHCTKHYSVNNTVQIDGYFQTKDLLYLLPLCL